MLASTYLEPLVLQHLLDGHHLPSVAKLGLVDHTEAAIADDLGVRVGHLLRAVGALPRRRHHCRHLAAVLA